MHSQTTKRQEGIEESITRQMLEMIVHPTRLYLLGRARGKKTLKNVIKQNLWAVLIRVLHVLLNLKINLLLVF